jgi:hypothetical protein
VQHSLQISLRPRGNQPGSLIIISRYEPASSWVRCTTFVSVVYVPVMLCVIIRPCAELYRNRSKWEVGKRLKIHCDHLFASRAQVPWTNNNGFWIGWLDLLTISFTISHNQITITHNEYSAWPFFRDCRGLSPFLFSVYGWLFSTTDSCYIASGGVTAQKIPLLYCDHVYHALPSNGGQKDHRKHRFCIVGRVCCGRCLTMVICVTFI